MLAALITYLYADRMDVMDILIVLASNIGLLFGGTQELPGRNVGRVTVSRPMN